MLRFLTGGESHGPTETVIIEGMPAGIEITIDHINRELLKRKTDIGRGGRSSIETDEAEILSGVRHGKTLGSPITIIVHNRDFTNWVDRMSPHPIQDSKFQIQDSKVTTPRPGHADYAGVIKYGFDDVRNVLERASARETVARVAAGAVFKSFLKEFEIEIGSHTIQIGPIKVNGVYPFKQIKNVFAIDPQTRCLDESARSKMQEAILEARKNRDTLGGVIEIVIQNVPIGMGSHVHWDRKLDANLSQALMSIPSVKAVEIGNGITNSGKLGSEVHDAMFADNPIKRETNRAGGIEGGISNGEDIVCHVFHKPLSTLMKPLPSVDIKTGKPVDALVERSDVCVIPRAGVISESMVAYVLAKELLIKYGGDSIEETKRNFKHGRN